MAAQPPSVLAFWIPEGRKSCLRLFQFRGGRGNSRDRRWTCKGPGGTEASRTPVLILRSIFFSTYEILYFSFLEVSLGSFIYISIYIFFFFSFHLKGVANHSSILAWRIPWTGEPGRLAMSWT